MLIPFHSAFVCLQTTFIAKKEKPALLAGNLPNTIIRYQFSYHFFHTYYYAILISLFLRFVFKILTN